MTAVERKFQPTGWSGCLKRGKEQETGVRPHSLASGSPQGSSLAPRMEAEAQHAPQETCEITGIEVLTLSEEVEQLKKKNPFIPS